MVEIDDFGYRTLLEGYQNIETIRNEDLEILTEEFPFENSPTEYLNPNYLLFEILRKKQESKLIEIFAKKLGVEKSVAEEILKAEAVDFYFPVVSPEEKKGFLLKGWVVKLKETKRVITPDRSIFTKPESLEVIGNIANSGFFMVLERTPERLEGFSYSLALYSALKFGKDAAKFAFTGSIAEDGKIERVDHVETKLIASKEAKKPLIFPAEGGINTLKKLEEFLYNLRIPVALLPEETDKRVFDKYFPFTGDYIKKVFHLEEELSNFNPYGESPHETATVLDWLEKLLNEIGEKIFSVKPAGAEYYVAHTQKVVVLSFLAGVIFAKKNIPVKFFKFVRDRGYQEIFSLNEARLTSSTPVDKFFKVIDPKGQIERIFISAKSQEVELPKGTLGIFAKKVEGQKGLPEELFLDIAGSLSGYLRSLRNRIEKEAKLILELPTALAFALGFAVEDYLPIVLTHISRQTKEEIPVYSFGDVISNKTVYVSEELSPEWLPEGSFNLMVQTKSVEDFLSENSIKDREFIPIQESQKIKSILDERGISLSEKRLTRFVLNEGSTLAVYFEKNGKGFFRVITLF